MDIFENRLSYGDNLTKEQVNGMTCIVRNSRDKVAATLSLLSLDGKIGYYNEKGTAKYFSVLGLDIEGIKSSIQSALGSNLEGLEIEELHSKMTQRRPHICVGLRILIKEGKVKKRDGIPDYYNRDVYYLSQDSDDSESE